MNEICNKKAIVFAIVALLIASISTVSLADWEPGDGHKMHYPQLPDENGWAVYATAGLMNSGYPEICLADDWLCTETGPVTDIHFWGAWKNGIEGNILAFVISIADDIPASQNPDGYSKPGATRWEGTFEFWDVVPIDPPSAEGWYNPYWDEVLYNDHVPYFQYNIVDIPNPFYQSVDTIYWLSISAIVAYEPTGFQPLWGWKSSIDHWNDDAVWSEWYYLNWIDLWEPSPPITNLFWIAMDPMGNPDPMLTGGTDYYDDGTGTSTNGWYYYPDSEWWNIWYYDHPLDYGRKKIIDTHLILSQWILSEQSWVDIAINWATDSWVGYDYPPLPGCDEYLYIGREIIYSGPAPETHIPIDRIYEILDYNPEWVSMDVRGHNFIIENGIIEHTCLQSLDLAFVITGEQPGEAIVEIEKTVWDNDLQEWVEEIDAEVGETVSFKIDVHNNGSYNLTNIFVTDTLPACLEYVEGSADPAPSDIVGNMIIWDFPGPLSYCNTITINFDADVVSDGINTNVVDVTADADDGSIVTASDTAIVHATEPLVPSVEIEKTVWDSDLQEWVDYTEVEIGTIARFNLSIHNTGQASFIVTKVLDVLPPCLEYADSATVNGMLWEPDVVTPPNYEWNYPLPTDYWYPGSEPGELPSGKWIYIEFDVHVNGPPCTDNINWAYWDVYYNDGYYSFEDNATIHPFSDEEPWPNHKMHYPQLPDPYGWDVLANWGMPFMPLADDWMCSETGPVTDIHFWGSWYYDVVGIIDGFDISIWDDIPSDLSPTGYSMPGTMLWNQYFSNYDMIDMTPSPQGWYDPSKEWFEFENHFNYYQYNIENIADPFIQQNETVYWLCIHPNVVESIYPDPPLWGWKTSQDHWNDNAVYWCEYNPPYCWMELWEPPDFSTPIDLSFVITGYLEDITPPVISDVMLTNSTPLDTDVPFGWENVSCNVTDNVLVNQVKLNVTNPDTTTVEYTMTKVPGTDTYYYNTTFTVAGDYTYYIWAIDTSDNIATSTPETFLLPENWDMNDDRVCTISDLRKVALEFGEEGQPGWIREDYNNDGTCTISDLRKVALCFGDTY